MNRKYFFLCLTIVCCWSLFLFFSDYYYQIGLNDGQYLVRDPDSLFFLRLYEQSMVRGEILKTDEYGCFPNFRKLEYPPFHLQFLITISGFLLWITQGLEMPISVLIGWLPPLLGWLIAIFMVFFAWKKTGNKNLTLLVAYSSVPGSLAAMNSLFLKIDYTFLSQFFIWTWILCGWLYIDSEKQIWKSFGFLVSLAFIFTWPGVPLFFFLVTLYVTLLILDQDEAARGFTDYCFFSMFSAAVMTILYLYFWGEASNEIGSFGYFQPASILVAAIFIKLVWHFSQLVLRSGENKARLSLALIGGAVFLAVVLAVYFGEQLRAGINFFLVSDVLMKSVSELRPGLLVSSILRDPRPFFNSIYDLSVLFFFFPFVLLANPDGIFNRGGRIVRDFSVIFLLMGFVTIRYYAWIGSVIGFWCGLALYSVFEYVSKYSVRNANSVKNGNSLFLRVAIILLPFMLMHFSLSYPIFYQSRKMTSEYNQAFRWMKENTPKTSGYLDRGRPEYCCYSFWDRGNLINYYAQRPTLVNNAMWGFKKMAAVFTAESEDEVYSLCEKYGIRYFYVDDYREFTNEMVRFLRAFKKRSDAPEDSYAFFPEYVDSGDENVSEYASSFHYWLSDCFAIAETEVFRQSASRLRIVYCSGNLPEKNLPEILIFEMVRGTKITGKAPPGAEVDLSLTCLLQKKKLSYRKKVRADFSGSFSFIVPYANNYECGNIKIGEKYLVTCKAGQNEKIAECYVSEKDLHEGKVIRLDL